MRGKALKSALTFEWTLTSVHHASAFYIFEVADTALTKQIVYFIERKKVNVIFKSCVCVCLFTRNPTYGVYTLLPFNKNVPKRYFKLN